MTTIHNFQDTISFIKICIEFPALFGITDTLERVFHGRTGIILRPLYLSGGKSTQGSHPFQDTLDNQADEGDAGCHHKRDLIGAGFGNLSLNQQVYDGSCNKGPCQPPAQKERGNDERPRNFLWFERFNQRSFHWAIRFSRNELMPSLASSVLQSLAKASFM